LVEVFPHVSEELFENVQLVEDVECEAGILEMLASLVVLWADAVELVRQYVSPLLIM
jgi:hypothetical protein